MHKGGIKESEEGRGRNARSENPRSPARTQKQRKNGEERRSMACLVQQSRT